MSIRYPKDNWILQRSGDELEGLEVEGTYFINYAMFDETMPKPWGAFFTHREPAYQKLFDEVASKVDYAVCLNKTIKKYLEDKGVKRVEIIHHGHDERLHKKSTFGVVGKVYPSGRKGEELVTRMFKEGYDVIAWGEGWNCPTYDNFSDIPWFYKEIDYLVITSREEGGPIPLIDSIASGKPVIVREGLGWCDDFPAIRYKSDEELFEILWKLTHPPTWEDWKEGHRTLFSSLNS